MLRGQVTSVVRGLTPGRHVSVMFEHARDRRAFVDASVRYGRAAGDRVVVVGASTDRAGTPSEVTGFERSRDRVRWAPEELPDPAWGLDGMVRFLLDQREQARAEGFRSLRVVGEMTWLWRARAEWPDELLGYERALDDEFAGSSDALVTCLFDRRRFRVDLLGRFGGIHDGVIDLTEHSGRPRLDFRVVPGSAPGSLVLEGECDVATEDALRGAIAAATASGGGRVTVDLGALTFASATTLWLLCGPALRGGQVVLERPSPLAREVLDLLGLAELPGVQVTTATPREATDDAGTEHAGTEHAGTEHAGTDDAESRLRDPDDTGTDDAATDHAGTDDAESRLRDPDDAGTDDAGTDDAATDHAGTEHAGTDDAESRVRDPDDNGSGPAGDTTDGGSAGSSDPPVGSTPGSGT